MATAPTIDAARAAKNGVADLLAAIAVPPGSPALTIRFRFPLPGEAEARPRATVVGSLNQSRDQVVGEGIDHGDGTISVRVGGIEGTLHVLFAVEDPVAGEGGAEVDADYFVAKLEQAFYADAAGDQTPASLGTELHGLSVVVPDYHGAAFTYTFEGVDDPPIELVERGIAERLVRIGVVGNVYQIITAPPTDPRLEAGTDGDLETFEVERDYSDRWSD